MRGDLKRRLAKLDPPRNSGLERFRRRVQLYREMSVYNPDDLERVQELLYAITKNSPVLPDATREKLFMELEDIQTRCSAARAARRKMGIAFVTRTPVLCRQ